MMRISRRIAMLGRYLRVSSFIVVAIATTLCKAQLEETNIEIQTVPPPPPEPSPSLKSQERFEDCNEYNIDGRLHLIRRHGDIWQKGASDCSNCTCDNGDIRCFFHFCKGPPIEYMTPPSSVSSLGLPNEDEDSFSNHIEDLEESSGFFPLGDDEEDEEDTSFPSHYGDLLWKTDAPSLHAPPTDESNALPPTGDGDETAYEEVEEPELTPRRDSQKNFCGKTCKKSCPKGFKVDPKTGCWRCRCSTKCPRRKRCMKACPLGFLKDADGCRRCSCIPPPSTKSTDEDIVFINDDEDVVRKEVAHPPSVGGGRKHHEDPSDSFSLLDVDDLGREGDRLPPLPLPFSLPQEDLHLLKDGDEEEQPQQQLPDRNAIHYHGTIPLDANEEPCNTTRPPGCHDDTRHLAVGDVWHRGPCVACKCVAPGYSECNITYCPDVSGCPRARRAVPPGICCPICRESSKTRDSKPFVDSLSMADRNEILQHDGRDPFPPMGLEGLPPILEENMEKAAEETIKEKFADEATVKSKVKADHSQLIMILVPMGVLFTLAILLFAHFWRRYHRDKYDINSYRPEEKEILHPVKTLQEDQTSHNHV